MKARATAFWAQIREFVTGPWLMVGLIVILLVASSTFDVIWVTTHSQTVTIIVPGYGPK